jgi:hypothetical protein
MSTYRATVTTVTTVTSAHWACHLCHLSASPVTGPTATEEATLLASVHDRVHHAGARTAQLLAGAVRAA